MPRAKVLTNCAGLRSMSTSEALSRLSQAIARDGRSGCLVHSSGVAWPFGDSLGLGLACVANHNSCAATLPSSSPDKPWGSISLRVTCVAVQDNAVTDLVLANQAQLCDACLTASAAASLATFDGSTWKDAPSSHRCKSHEALIKLLESIQIMLFSLKARAKGVPVHTLIHFQVVHKTAAAGTSSTTDNTTGNTNTPPAAPPATLSATLVDLEGCEAADLNTVLAALASSGSTTTKPPPGVSQLLWGLVLPHLTSSGLVLVTEAPEARRKAGEATWKLAKLEHALEMHKARGEQMATKLEAQALNIRQLEQDKQKLMEHVLELQAMVLHGATSDLPCCHPTSMRPGTAMGQALLARMMSSGLSSCGPATPPLQPAASVLSTFSQSSLGPVSSCRPRPLSAHDTADGCDTAPQTHACVSRAPSPHCMLEQQHAFEPQLASVGFQGEHVDEPGGGRGDGQHTQHGAARCHSTHSTSACSSLSGCQAWDQSMETDMGRACSDHSGRLRLADHALTGHALDSLSELGVGSGLPTGGGGRGGGGSHVLSHVPLVLSSQILKSRMDWLSSAFHTQKTDLGPEGASEPGSSGSGSGSGSGACCSCKAELVGCRMQLEQCRDRLTVALAAAPDVNVELMKEEVELLREECSAAAVELAIHKEQVAKLTTQLYDRASWAVGLQALQPRPDANTVVCSTCGERAAPAQLLTATSADAGSTTAIPARVSSPYLNALTITSHVRAAPAPASSTTTVTAAAIAGGGGGGGGGPRARPAVVAKSQTASPIKTKTSLGRPTATSLQQQQQHVSAAAAEAARRLAELPRKPALPKFNLVQHSHAGGDVKKQAGGAAGGVVAGGQTKAAVWRAATKAMAALEKTSAAGKVKPTGGGVHGTGGGPAPGAAAVGGVAPGAAGCHVAGSQQQHGGGGVKDDISIEVPLVTHVFDMRQAGTAHVAQQCSASATRGLGLGTPQNSCKPPGNGSDDDGEEEEVEEELMYELRLPPIAQCT